MKKATTYEFCKPGPILSYVEKVRLRLGRIAERDTQKELGQYLTPAPVACFMASLMKLPKDELRLLDPGAGIGSLTAAVVDRALAMPNPPKTVSVVAWELDGEILPFLHRTLRRCQDESRKQGVRFSYVVVPEDFIETGSKAVFDLEAGKESFSFNRVILNPPYRKIQSDSSERLALRRVKIETSNLYAGFVALTVRLLESGGELVAITPRSFCNGPYFKGFRNQFLKYMRFRHIHTFERRDRAFADDNVLQENIIFHAKKSSMETSTVLVTASDEPSGEIPHKRLVRYEDVIPVDDPEHIIHIPSGESDKRARTKVLANTCGLPDLGVSVSTGRVVDFRAKEHLRAVPEADTVPLIYPMHFDNGTVSWPRSGSRKPNAISRNDATLPLLLPTGFYVLVKRFTSKEEARRIVAVVFDPRVVHAHEVAFENHVNVYHVNGHGMPETLAKGIAAYLNTTIVDKYFRQFSGHTQVNAADLRKLCYPSRVVLERIGCVVDSALRDQAELDATVEGETIRCHQERVQRLPKERRRSTRPSLS